MELTNLDSNNNFYPKSDNNYNNPSTENLIIMQNDPSIRVCLESRHLWQKFASIGTEMIITKCGRRMFPTYKVNVFGLEPNSKYIFLMDIVIADNNRYKYNNSSWNVSGKAEMLPPGSFYIHPESPSLGSQWMKQSILFHKMKLTNNLMDNQGQV
jgi:hypothetical protein